MKAALRLTLRLLSLLLAFAPAWAVAQDYEFHAPASADDPGTAAALRDLAERMLPVYQDADTERYLDNLSALQLADSNYAAADDARQSLRERQKSAQQNGEPRRWSGRGLAMDLYTHARTVAATGSAPLAGAFAQTFRETVPRLGDQDADAATAWLATPPALARDALQVALDRTRAADRIGEEEAIELIWAYLTLDARRSLGPLVGALAAEDDRRRYLADDEVLLRGAGGAQIHVRVMRPKGPARKRPALLEFTLAARPDEARGGAAHGYAGVVAYTRARPGRNGKSAVAGGVTPFEHEGEDARTVIRWIARQPWSDGRVGMYGDGYGGFAAWSAARHLPPALKAIATADAVAPGIDFPAPGRIFRNAAYPWALAAQSADGGSGRDAAQWRALDQKWYRSGKPYRAFDRLAGAHNRSFDQWLAHPSYDRYWQKMIPYGKQFARIGIPALTVSGYYADAEPGALYYFGEHRRYRPDADHTLLLGPYGEHATRDGPAPLLGGHALDAAALLDLRELRLRWFDHVFKGTALPPPLQDRVNYQLMGANEWRHAPSLEAMANSALKFYLDPAASGERRRLAPASPAGDASVDQVVKFSDRSDAGWTAPQELLSRKPALRNGLSFVSEPLQQPAEFAGALSGQLDFKLNRMDLDLELNLYELLPGGEQLRLTQPCAFRASYAGDRIHRRLLRDGERQQRSFTCEQIGARRLQAGSRLLLSLEVIKRPDRQINYGGGGEVSDEALADFRGPLKIRWYGGSSIEVPVRK